MLPGSLTPQLLKPDRFSNLSAPNARTNRDIEHSPPHLLQTACPPLSRNKCLCFTSAPVKTRTVLLKVSKVYNRMRVPLLLS